MAKIVKRKGRWVCDHYRNGKRARPTFETRAEAEDFKRELLLSKSVGGGKLEGTSIAASNVIKSMTLVNAVNNYYELETLSKAEKSRPQEQKWFEILIEFAERNNLKFVHDIKLLHLQKLQKELQAKNRVEERQRFIDKRRAKSKNPAVRKLVGTPIKMESGSLTNSAINRFFNTYRDFFTKCVQWEAIAKSPTEHLENLEEAPRIRKIWEDEKINQAIEKAYEGFHWSNNGKPSFTDTAWAGDVYYFLAWTGCRPIEACNLRIPEIDFERNFFWATTRKGTGKLKRRMVPMIPEVANFLSKKIAENKRRVIGIHADRVFLTRVNTPVTTNALDRVLARIIKALGLQGYELYGFRHSFVTATGDVEGGNLEHTRQLAGHSNLSTTQGYMHPRVERIREAALRTAKVRGLKSRE